MSEQEIQETEFEEGEKSQFSDSDFTVNRSKIKKLQHRVTELPSRLRLAAQGAWRGKERGLAVKTGVII